MTSTGEPTDRRVSNPWRIAVNTTGAKLCTQTIKIDHLTFTVTVVA